MSARHPGRPKKEGTWPPCKVKECTVTTKGGSRGFCPRHYHSARKGIFDWETGEQLRPLRRVRSYGADAVCSVAACGRRPKVNGLCGPHWLRQQRGQDFSAPIQSRAAGSFTLCTAPACAERARNRGLCAAHSDKFRRGLIDAQGNKLREPLVTGRPRKKERWVGREGYVLVRAPPGHPHARKDGSILEHRLVMEQALGRFLADWEIIHHKNGQRSDNALENLELLDGRAQKASEAHPPGHEFDVSTALQVVLQQDTLPEQLRSLLRDYRADTRHADEC